MVNARILCNAKNGMASFVSFHQLTDLNFNRRALSDDEKESYIDAVKCLQSQPARNTSKPASWTRFDEFQATHIDMSFDIHFVVYLLSDPFTADLCLMRM